MKIQTDEHNERLAALIAADIRAAMERFPDDAFAAEARRRLAARRVAARPLWRPARLALPLAAMLLVTVSVAFFLSRRGSFSAPVAPTLGQQLQAMAPSAPAPLVGSGDALAGALERLMADAGRAPAGAPAAVPEPGEPGVAAMLRRQSVYRFLQQHANFTQEG